MDISFKNRKLEKYANNDKQAVKNLGTLRHKKYKMRLGQLRSSKTLEDVRHQPGRFHELTENRKGQWACNLDHPYRLIFKPQEDPIPTNDNGNYIWIGILGIEIVEIVDYHNKK